MLVKALTQVAFISVILGLVECDTGYRLNTTISPSAYSIAITPYFDTGDGSAFTFDGEVAITFAAGLGTNKIKLHSQDLQYTASNITLTCGVNDSYVITSLEFEENYTFAHINLDKNVPSGIGCILKIIYKGLIRSDLSGFYRNYYIEKGVKKWLGATQMEPTHARKVFPCFDEPELKAIFTLTITRPAHYSPSLSNTKLQSSVNQSNGYVRELFYPTPKMSTYLVAFLVSEFEAGATNANVTKEFGVYSRPEAANQTKYAFDFGLRVVEALGKYYGIDYYSTNNYIKLDHIALPDFNAGAMENWGLVKYREALLLYVPGESSPLYKYRVAQIVAHETTHMWFGNLVTCHWWSDTWLNEGFANYFQDYITAMIEPEVGSADVLVVGSVYAAYDADDEPDSPPISNQNVNSPAEISAHFGTITYQKAGSVIRMIHHLIGDDAFKFGLNSYLKENQFKPGYPDKMYAALDLGVSQFNSLSDYSGVDVASVMGSWITRPGHPILNVEVNYENASVVLSQKRFYINSTHESNEIYTIPITYTTGSNPDFSNTKPNFIMRNQTHILSLPEISNGTHNWILFNLQETGLYRVNYDLHSWSMIGQVLKGSQREEIHHLNRAKIVNDLFAFLYADYIDFELLQDILGFLKEETDHAVWNTAISGFSQLQKYYIGSDTLTLLDDFVLQLLENIITKLGFEVQSSDNLTTQKNRMQILQYACRMGHEKCIQHSVELFRSFKNNSVEIHPSLRSIAYCSGLRFGDGGDYDFMWERMATTNVANEARLISELLGCTTKEDKLKSYLYSMLVENSPIKTQDLTTPIASVLSNYSHVHIVLEVLQENMTLWNSVYPSMGSVLSTIASSLHTEQDFNDYEEWLAACSACSEESKTSARGALKKAKEVKAWADSHEARIKSTLKNTSDMITSSILLTMTMILFTIYSY